MMTNPRYVAWVRAAHGDAAAKQAEARTAFPDRSRGFSEWIMGRANDYRRSRGYDRWRSITGPEDRAAFDEFLGIDKATADAYAAIEVAL